MRNELNCSPIHLLTLKASNLPKKCHDTLLVVPILRSKNDNRAEDEGFEPPTLLRVTV